MSVLARARSLAPWFWAAAAVAYITVIGPWLISAKDTPTFLTGLALGCILIFAVYRYIKKAVQ